jgi:acetyl-CoA carboxylase biotin carboxyl carrier protein
MTNDEILQLIQLAQETGVAELEVARGENRVRIRLGTITAAPQEVVVGPAGPAARVLNPAPAAAAVAADPMADPALILVKSPIVGTFYEAASPGAPPFVKVGDPVSPGKVLCIIESMKLMNEIECEHTGTIVAKMATNSKPVEYGETLFAIKPN